MEKNYKVTCTLKYRDEERLVSCAKMFIGETKAPIADFENAEGLAKALLAGKAKCQGPGQYSAEFKAGPEWEGVMADVFRGISYALEEDSQLEIVTDDTYRIMKIDYMQQVEETAGFRPAEGSGPAEGKSVYEAFKWMLQKRNGCRRAAGDPEELFEKAGDYLSHVSLRRHLGDLDVEKLVTETEPEENPVYFLPTPIWDRELACCEENGRMRAKYGSIPAAFNSQVAEFAAWCVLFPERRKELLEKVFPGGDFDSYEVVFGSVYGCDMGDKLTFPNMVTALNACLFRELMQDWEEDLAMSILDETETA